MNRDRETLAPNCCSNLHCSSPKNNKLSRRIWFLGWPRQSALCFPLFFYVLLRGNAIDQNPYILYRLIDATVTSSVFLLALRLGKKEMLKEKDKKLRYFFSVFFFFNKDLTFVRTSNPWNNVWRIWQWQPPPFCTFPLK